jgi:5,10-methylenetetrahydromethanopterin reductase
MKIGIVPTLHAPPEKRFAPSGIQDFAAFHQEAQDLEKMGFHTIWLSSLFNVEHFTSLAYVAQVTQNIRLGTSVIPIYVRHPVNMAQGARTLQWASNGRFRLGIGLAHKPYVEQNLGLPFEQPASYMHEYIQVLLPLLQGKDISFKGRFFNVECGAIAPDAEPVPLYLAALGPKMLDLCARYSEGTILWMSGPKTIETYIKPLLKRGAAEAGRSEPGVIAGIPIAVTSNKKAAYQRAGTLLSNYNNLPSYRTMLDREGYNSPADAAVIGDEAEVEHQIRCLFDSGIDELLAVPFEAEPGGVERTVALLASMVQ